MIQKIFITLLLLTLLQGLSQENKLNKITIAFKVQDSIFDEPLFDQELNHILAKVDSISNKGKENPFYGFNRPSMQLFLDPRANQFILPEYYKFTFQDSLITISRTNHNKQTSETEVNLLFETYKIVGSTQTPKKWPFRVKQYVEIIENREDTKRILNYNCYKVVLKEKQVYLLGDIDVDYSGVFEDKYIITEMYVTDEIQSYFHPLIFDKVILKKYYPLEIKVYNGALKGSYKLMIVQ